MSSAGYNGWADAPEEEREGAEPFERDTGLTGETPVAELPMLPPATPVAPRRAPHRRRDDRAA